MTQHPDLFAALAAPFETNEVKIRPSQNGRQLHYITARTAMNRLDSILGPENWWDEYVPLEKSVVCKLSVRLPDGLVITKSDAGGYAGMSDGGDDDKSGFSDAFKRAASKFGVARYLYRDGVPAFVREREPSTDLAAVAPSNPVAESSALTPTSAPAARANGNGSAPRTGKAMFAWTKDQEQKYEVGLLKYLNSWAKLQDLPARMVEWDGDQVALAHAEACRKLQALQPAGPEGFDEAMNN